MNRGACLGFVALLAAGPATTAVAQTPVERGSYLVNTVMTCHNCHTPMGPNGPQFDKALSGGLRFNEPPFDVTGSNLTPDPETGLGKWSDADIKKALLDGVRPIGPSSGRGHAHRLLQDLHARRSRRHRRLSALAEAGQQQGEGSRLQDGDPAQGVSRRREAHVRGRSRRQGETRLLSRHHRATAWSATRRLVRPDREPIFRIRSARAAANFPGRGARRPRATSRRARPAASAIGATPTSSAPSRKACARTAAGSSRRWAIRYYAKMTDGDLDAMVAYLRTVPAKE